MKMTEDMKRELLEYRPRIEAILALAAANFPRTNEVRVETVGSEPSGTMVIPYYLLSALVDAGYHAIEQEGST